MFVRRRRRVSTRRDEIEASSGLTTSSHPARSVLRGTADGATNVFC
jgi:hypothetical protein